jgi:hypothetical protein
MFVCTLAQYPHVQRRVAVMLLLVVVVVVVVVSVRSSVWLVVNVCGRPRGACSTLVCAQLPLHNDRVWSSRPAAVLAAGRTAARVLSGAAEWYRQFALLSCVLHGTL